MTYNNGPLQVYAKIAAKAEKAPERDWFRIVIEFTNAIAEAMADRQMSRVHLAKCMGVSPAYITKILKGDINLTIETMTRLARAVECTPKIILDQVVHTQNAEAWQKPDQNKRNTAEPGYGPDFSTCPTQCLYDLAA